MTTTLKLVTSCTTVLLLAATSAGAHAQSSAPASSGTRNGNAAMPAGMPPGTTTTRGDKGAVPSANTMPTDPKTGSTPGMPPQTTDGAATPKGKGKGHGKHMHGDSAASDAATSTP